MFSTDFFALAIDIVLRPSKLVSLLVTFMAESPIIKTLNNLVGQLKESTEALREAEKSVSGLTAAIRALAQVCEDEEVKTAYLLALEEISGKPGFADAVRYALRVTGKLQTPSQIKGTIVLMKRMDLSVYSNPMASIHTTLRRMKEKGEIEEATNESGEKAYRIITKPPGELKRELQKFLRPQERFSLDHTKPTKTKQD